MAICIVENCNKNRQGYGYCRKHYNRYKKYGGVGEEVLSRRPPGKFIKCSVEECNKNTYGKNNLCEKHYMRLKTNGSVLDIAMKRAPNGNGYINSYGYRIFKFGQKRIPEHRYIMQQHMGRELDVLEHVHHINGDKLDNRIENLIIIEKGEHSKFHRSLDKMYNIGWYKNK